MRIDAHQHFWQLKRGDYDWLTPDLKILYRDFEPIDLDPYLKQLKIDGTVLVQAAPTAGETHYLLDIANRYPFILGVVGWIDMLALDASFQLSTLAKNKIFRGIRPMLQSLPIDWILNPALLPCIDALEKMNLTLDALVYPKHLPYLIQFVERHPQLKVVIDHGAKPLIYDQLIEPWASDIITLSHFPNVYCKLSGLLTESIPNATFGNVKPYMEHLIQCFDQRLMWGSDYPVVNLASDYKIWFEMAYNYINQLHSSLKESIFCKAAQRFYDLVI
jgi:L-fuconolactonase